MKKTVKSVLVSTVLTCSFLILIGALTSFSYKKEPKIIETPNSKPYGLARVVKLFDIFGYTHGSVGTTFIDISGTGTSSGITTGVGGNDVEVNIQMPFEFNFYGTISRDLRVSSNGAILFDATTGSVPAANATFPNAANPLMIAPYWDDMWVFFGDIYYETQGTAPNRMFIVQYEDLSANILAFGTGTFEVIFYEGTNNIDFVYQDSDFNGTTQDNGESATIGINRNGTDAELNSFNVDGSANSGTAIRFTHPDNAVAMSFTSSTTTQSTVSNVSAGSTDNVIIGIEVVVNGNTAALSTTNFNFNTTGTTDAVNDIQNAKVYYTGTAPEFATDVQFGSTVASPNGTFSIPGTQALVNGTNYFWLSYDIQGGATNSNFVDAQCTNVTVGSVRTPTVTAPAGNREIGGTGTTCADALGITPVCGTTININGTTVGGDTGLNIDCGPNASANTDEKVWHTFTGNGASVTATTIDIGDPNLNDTQLWVYSGTCAGLTCVADNDDSGGLFSSVTFTADEGTTYYIVVGAFDGTPAGAFQLDVTFDAAMTYTSSTTTQNTATLGQSATNEQIIGVEVVMADDCDPLDLTSLTFNTTGSTDAANDIDNARVFYTGTSNTFATTTQVGATQVNPNGTFTVTGFTQGLSSGTNYFWLAYDIAAAATDGNVVDAQCTSITVDGVPRTPGVTAPAGSRLIGNSGATCADALAITPVCGTTININGTTVGGDTGLNIDCGPNASANTDEKVWHTFTGNGASVTATTIDIGDPNLNDTQLWVYSGTCTGLTCVADNDDSGGLFSSVTFTADEGTTYYIVVGAFDGTPAGAFQLDVTFDADMTYTSSTTTQNTSSTVQSAINEQIIGIEVVMGGDNCDPLDITSLTFNTTGSTDPANDIDNARVFYTGTSATFATTTQIGATQVNPNGTFTVNGFTQTLANGTNYFWLAYDIAAGAADGNVVDAQCTSITIDGTPRTPSVVSPSGSRTINPEANILRGNLLDFDGGDRVEAVGYTGVTGSNDRTIEMWVRSNQNNNRTLMEWGQNSAPGGRRWLIQRRTAGTVRVNIRGNNVTTTTSGNFIDIDDGTWHHLAVVLAGTTLNDIDFYVDGILQNKGSNGTTINTASVNNVFIGSNATGGNNYNGEIEEVRIWDDARTEDEIRENMHITLQGNEPNLVSYWQFNETSGNSFADATASGNTLTGGGGAANPTIETSTVAVAGGVSNLQVVNSTGNTTFTGTGMSMNFTVAPSSASDFVVYRLTGEDAPGNDPLSDILTLNTVTSHYWVVRTFGATGFTTNVTFDLGSTAVSAADEATPSNLKLVSRASNSFGTWSSVGDANTALEATGIVTFNGVTSFSQLKVGTINNSPLPITLSSFKGYLTDDLVQLEWTTSTEINNDYFEILHSADGVNYQTIGTIEGSGSTNEAMEYTFKHNNPLIGNNYYKLKQVDFDGQFSIENEVVVVDYIPSNTPFSLTISPNPIAENEVNLRVEADSGESITITIFDLYGKKIVDNEYDAGGFAQNIKIELNDVLDKGVYMITLEQYGKRIVKRFVVAD